MKQLKIEVGKSYRTRDGRKATVTGMKGTARYPATGHVEGLNHDFNWNIEGLRTINLTDSFDLVTELPESTDAESRNFINEEFKEYACKESPDIESELNADDFSEYLPDSFVENFENFTEDEKKIIYCLCTDREQNREYRY